MIRKIFKTLFLITAVCIALLVALNHYRHDHTLYYVFPSKDGISEIEIPKDIIKKQDCVALKSWMGRYTPAELIMEQPDCPWQKIGLLGKFSINNNQFCIPRDYISVDKFKASGEVAEIHIKFHFDSLEPINQYALLNRQHYQPDEYIDILIQRTFGDADADPIELCQSRYWGEVISLFEASNYQPSESMLQLRLEQKSAHGTDLDHYVIENWKRCCITHDIIDPKSKSDPCKNANPHLFIPSIEDPTQPKFWIQCSPAQGYKDVRDERAVCKIKVYEKDYAVAIFFYQEKYLPKYKELLNKTSEIIDRFKGEYYCKSDSWQALNP